MCARIARTDLLYKGCYAHVISRSIRKLKIFRADEDFEVFRKELLIEKRKKGFRIFHYCLMQTHFHLVVEIPDVIEFSRSLARAKSNYARAFHSKYRLSGPIWRERYRSLLIENEKYLTTCGYYIEANPVRVGIVKRMADWPYSSHRFYHQKSTDVLVDGFKGCNSSVREEALEELNPKDFEHGSVIGSTFFKFQFFQNRRKR